MILRSLLGRELPAFSLFDTEIIVAGEGTDYTNMPIESAPPLEILQAEKEAALQNTGDIQGNGEGGKTEIPRILLAIRTLSMCIFLIIVNPFSRT